MGAKRGAMKDFGKVKAKVGKKLRPSANETATGFKAVKVHVANGVAAGKDGADGKLTRQHKTLEECMLLCRHATPAAREGGIKGLKELADSSRDIASAPSVLAAGAAASCDGSAAVRAAAQMLLRSDGVRGVPHNAARAAMPLILAHARRAMASDLSAVSRSGIGVVDAVADAFPGAVKEHRDDTYAAFADVLVRRADNALAPMSARSLEAGEVLLAAAARFAAAAGGLVETAAAPPPPRVRTDDGDARANAFANAPPQREWGIRLDPAPTHGSTAADDNDEGAYSARVPPGARNLATQTARFLSQECLRGLGGGGGAPADDEATAHAHAAASATLRASWLLCVLPVSAVDDEASLAVERAAARAFPLNGGTSAEANAALLAVLLRWWRARPEAPRGAAAAARRKLLPVLLEFSESYLDARAVADAPPDARVERRGGNDAALARPAAWARVLDAAVIDGVRAMTESDALWSCCADTLDARRASLLERTEALAFDAPRSAMGCGVLFALCHHWRASARLRQAAASRALLSARAERHAAGLPRALHHLGTPDARATAALLDALLDMAACIPLPASLAGALTPLFSVVLGKRVAHGPFSRWPASVRAAALSVAEHAAFYDSGPTGVGHLLTAGVAMSLSRV